MSSADNIGETTEATRLGTFEAKSHTEGGQAFYRTTGRSIRHMEREECPRIR